MEVQCNLNRTNYLITYMMQANIRLHTVLYTYQFMIE